MQNLHPKKTNSPSFHSMSSIYIPPPLSISPSSSLSRTNRPLFGRLAEPAQARGVAGCALLFPPDGQPLSDQPSVGLVHAPEVRVVGPLSVRTCHRKQKGHC